MKPLVLFSGGLDSTVTLWEAFHASLGEHLGTISFSYGSKHNARERAAAKDILYTLPAAKDEGVFQIPEWVFAGSGSTLMQDGGPVPLEEYHDPQKETPSSTVVPYRNGVLLSIAAAFALTHGYDTIYTGIHATDAAGWAYPDCSPEFWGAQASAVYIGTMREVRVVAPFMHATKAQVVKRGGELHVPMAMSYSCYRGEAVHCGECPTCRERRLAFLQAGVNDRTVYRV